MNCSRQDLHNPFDSKSYLGAEVYFYYPMYEGQYAQKIKSIERTLDLFLMLPLIHGIIKIGFSSQMAAALD